MSGIIGIDVQNIFKKLGPNQALSGVSMNFEAGLMHGLIGPEGAGKTTLLRVLMDLLHADSGGIRYTLDGKTVPLSAVRKEMTYLPQQQSLYADLSISEHLDFFRALYRIPKGEYTVRRKELLRMTRLEEFVHRPAGKLSGGMYKKLGLMCALLKSPQAILLDEPTNGVDPISRREFWELLHGLSLQKILVIMTTSYMEEAERCSRVHLIQTGQCLDQGEPKTLLKKHGVESFDALFLKRGETA